MILKLSITLRASRLYLPYDGITDIMVAYSNHAPFGSWTPRHAQGGMKASARIGLFLVLLAGLAARACAERWEVLNGGPLLAYIAEQPPAGTWGYTPDLFAQELPDKRYFMENTQNFMFGLGNHLGFYASRPIVPFDSEAYFEATQFNFGWQMTKDENTSAFLSKPALGTEVSFVNSQEQNLEGLFFMAHKRDKPFEFYAQVGSYVQNSYASTLCGSSGTCDVARQIPGQLFIASLAFEQILDQRTAFGYIVEAFGEDQSLYSRFGKTNVAPWSYASVAPELELTWPNEPDHALTWRAGVMIPAYRNNYFPGYTPIAALTYFFNYRGRSLMSN